MVAFAVATVSVIGGATALSLASGSWRLPHNDDWAFTKIAEHIGRTGHVELVGWNGISTVGQIVVLGPLADQVVVRRIFVATMATMVLALFGYLLHRLSDRPTAAMATISAAVITPFPLLATSFMTDLPALGAALASVALFTKAWETRSARMLWASVAVGTWGATIREVAIASVLTIFVTAAYALLRTPRDRWAVHTLAASMFGGTLFFVFMAWRRSLPDGTDPVFSLTLAQDVAFGLRSFFTVSFSPRR